MFHCSIEECGSAAAKYDGRADNAAYDAYQHDRRADF